MASLGLHMADAGIFQDIQRKIDDDSKFRDQLREFIQDIEKSTRSLQALLQTAHSSPKENLDQIFRNIGYDKIKDELVSHIQSLAKTASEQPYYKWNQTWTRSTQEAVSLILIRSWVSTELLLKPTEISELLSVPVGEVTKDSFHISTEEYLLAVITLIEELSRLARNAVTIGEYGRPLAISRFIKDIHAGFQTLNLKNDILRKRSDGIKYRLKDVEDVVYDLSLRNLLPKTTPV